MSQQGRLQDKVAIVTGAGLGIGKAIAQRYVEEGARVVIAELKPETGQAVAAELGENAFFVETDASDMPASKRWCRPRSTSSVRSTSS